MLEPGQRLACWQARSAGLDWEAAVGARIRPHATSTGAGLQGGAARALVQRMLGGVPPLPYASVAETSEGFLEFGACMRIAGPVRRRNAAHVDFTGLSDTLQAL